jgi:hypothetical protein
MFWVFLNILIPNVAEKNILILVEEKKKSDSEFLSYNLIITLHPSMSVQLTSYSLCLNVFAPKPNLEKIYIYSNKFFHNFHLSESSFTCPGLRVWFFVSFRIFFSDNTRVRISFFVAPSAIFFSSNVFL